MKFLLIGLIVLFILLILFIFFKKEPTVDPILITDNGELFLNKQVKFDVDFNTNDKKLTFLFKLMNEKYWRKKQPRYGVSVPFDPNKNTCLKVSIEKDYFSISTIFDGIEFNERTIAKNSKSFNFSLISTEFCNWLILDKISIPFISVPNNLCDHIYISNSKNTKILSSIKTTILDNFTVPEIETQKTLTIFKRPQEILIKNTPNNILHINFDLIKNDNIVFSLNTNESEYSLTRNILNILNSIILKVENLDEGIKFSMNNYSVKNIQPEIKVVELQEEYLGPIDLAFENDLDHFTVYVNFVNKPELNFEMARFKLLFLNGYLIPDTQYLYTQSKNEQKINIYYQQKDVFLNQLEWDLDLKEFLTSGEGINFYYLTQEILVLYSNRKILDVFKLDQKLSEETIKAIKKRGQEFLLTADAFLTDLKNYSLNFILIQDPLTKYFSIFDQSLNFVFKYKPGESNYSDLYIRKKTFSIYLSAPNDSEKFESKYFIFLVEKN